MHTYKDVDKENMKYVIHWHQDATSKNRNNTKLVKLLFIFTKLLCDKCNHLTKRHDGLILKKQDLFLGDMFDLGTGVMEEACVLDKPSTNLGLGLWRTPASETQVCGSTTYVPYQCWHCDSFVVTSLTVSSVETEHRTDDINLPSLAFIANWCIQYIVICLRHNHSYISDIHQVFVFTNNVDNS